MNVFIRPALYGARHEIKKLTGKEPVKRCNVAGPVCESSDVFARSILLPEVSYVDLLAIRSTCAYGQPVD